MPSLLGMELVNVQEAKTHLSKLLEKVANGEEVILAKAGQPVARIVPYVSVKAARKGGQLSGQIIESADCWNSPEEPFAESIEGALYASVAPFASSKVAEEGKA